MPWVFTIKWKDGTESIWSGLSCTIEEVTRTLKAFYENLDGNAKSFSMEIVCQDSEVERAKGKAVQDRG